MRRIRIPLLIVPLMGIAACVPSGDSSDRVVIAVPVGPTSPYPDRNLEEYATTILANVYEGLVKQARNLSFEPCLAESWETPDELTWIFRLRSGVQLHDGRALQAQHIVDAYRSGQNLDRVELGGSLVVESISAPDDRTIVIETPSKVFSVDAFAFHIAVESESTSTSLVGTGPYRLDHLDPTGSVQLTAFEDYWGGKPETDKLEFRVAADPKERIDLLQRGEAHLAPGIVFGGTADGAAKDQALALSSQGARVIYLGMRCDTGILSNGRANPFSDVHVRRAVAHAIDREALIEETLGGHGQVSDQLVVSGVFGYVPGKQMPAYDPEKSVELLAESEFPADTQFDLEFPRGKYVDIANVADAIAEDLNAVGIQVQPRARSIGELTTGKPSLWLLGWITTRNAMSAYNYLIHSPIDDLGSLNLSAYSNSEVDAALYQARIAPPGERIQFFESVSEALVRDVPLVPLYRQADRYGVAKGLEFEPRLDRRIYGIELRWSGN